MSYVISLHACGKLFDFDWLPLSFSDVACYVEFLRMENGGSETRSLGTVGSYFIILHSIKFIQE